MALSDAQIAHTLELFDGLGPVTYRKMFGGLGLYLEGTIFGIVMSDGAILLKGAGAFREKVEADGWQAWTYPRKSGGVSQMPYWHLPDAALEDPDLAVDLAREALAAL